jgi:hypothetical protein
VHRGEGIPGQHPVRDHHPQNGAAQIIRHFGKVRRPQTKAGRIGRMKF